MGKSGQSEWMRKWDMISIGVTVPEDFVKKFTELALTRGQKRNEALREAMRDFIVKHEKTAEQTAANQSV